MASRSLDVLMKKEKGLLIQHQWSFSIIEEIFRKA